jgi:long-subunit fatty acid transport protein
MNPVGSGARATGMGGAFIAVADDATAASWNPAGLIHLEKPEVSIVYSYFNRSQSYNSSTHPELMGTTHEIDLHDINYASLAYPFTLLDRNMIVTINYQRLYDMNKRVNTNLTETNANGDFVNKHISFTQEGYLGAISPAIAIQIMPDLYFGASVNIFDDIFGTSNWGFREKGYGTGQVLGLPYQENFLWTEKNTFSGLNANLGLLYTLNGKYSFGFVFKTPFTASVKKETVSTSEGITTIPFPGFPPVISTTNLTSSETFTYDMPLSYGFGFAYRHSDNLSFALDIYRTQWSDFAITNQNGTRINPITGASLDLGKPRDTTQIRTGAEYLFIGDKLVIPVRAGIFYDPEPGREKIDDFFGFSVGSGITYDKWAFDFSYQYRWGSHVSSDISQSGISMDTTQHTVMTSLIYHF